ncbi:serine hydrolase domain-containing protein [Flavobacterium hercynium]|uniref:Beta-lactamase n=1 Tax=Flavobacterium hercynium TaxID=387094 RepID=A0A226GUX3_9FLAO|nr:serine hydrolase domain-containing protein [Flavobacterium hercynium]OXA85787.1 serine hydrolase [Flavobacterium hercynium]SMP15317.1 CubicO group peptidase, beta-lactamase class C family [Flavobacterium hercynium]
MKNRFLLLLLLSSIFCVAQNSQSKNIKTFIDSAANKMIKKPLIHSTSIAIVYQGKEFIGHYGALEEGKNNRPDNETVYEIGSVSKTFAGTLAAKAVTEKKLNIEDEVQKYLPENYSNLKFGTQPILIKHLLSHTSGLPNMLPLEANTILQDFTNHDTPAKINELYKNYGEKDFLRDLHKVKIDTVPGYKYSYSSAGSQLIAFILEKVYKTKYEKLLTDYVAKDMAMQHTKINLSDQEAKKLAVGYHSDNSTITFPMPKLPWGASGTMKSTVPDMVNYIKFQLKNNETVAESHKTIVKFNNEFSIGYLWNIATEDKKLGTFYIHHGGVPRSQCFIYIIPKYDLGGFIITNQSGTDTPKVMSEAINQIFDKIIQQQQSN